MGIEIPEEYGGQGGSFFQCVLAMEELSAVDPSAGVIVDVQNTIVNNAILRWANDDQKQRYLPRLATDTVASYALSEAGSGSDAFALATRARGRWRPLPAHRTQALDHQRRRIGPVPAVCQRQSRRRISRHHGVPDRARVPGLSGRQEGRQAGLARFVHLRADSGQLRVPEGERAGRGGQGLQDRHRDAE